MNFHYESVEVKNMDKKIRRWKHPRDKIFHFPPQKKRKKRNVSKITELRESYIHENWIWFDIVELQGK